MTEINFLARVAKQGDKKLIIIPTIWHDYLPSDEACMVNIKYPVELKD